MKIQIDSLVAERCPELVSASTADVTVGVFDVYSAPWDLRVAWEASRPDVIVVDPALVVVSFLLMEIVRGPGAVPIESWWVPIR